MSELQPRSGVRTGSGARETSIALGETPFFCPSHIKNRLEIHIDLDEMPTM